MRCTSRGGILRSRAERDRLHLGCNKYTLSSHGPHADIADRTDRINSVDELLSAANEVNCYESLHSAVRVHSNRSDI